MVNSENFIEIQKNHFNSVAEKYYNARKDSNHLLLKKLMWTQILSENLGGFDSSKPTVLEPMCGYGEGKNILEDFGELNILYTGFDYSEELVEKAAKTWPDCKISHQDITQFETTEKYDLIILIGGLHHVYRQTDDVLKRLRSALKPGGSFINYEPTQNNFIFKMVRNAIYKKNTLFDYDTEKAFDLDKLNESYRNSGFIIKDQQYPGLLSYVLYYNPDAFPWLNLGGKWMVRFCWWLDKLFIKTRLGSYFSFATVSFLTTDKGQA